MYFVVLSGDAVPNFISTTPQLNGDASPSPLEPAIPPPTGHPFPPVNAAKPDTIINNNSVITATAAASLPHHPFSTTTTTTTTTTTSASNISSNVIQSNPAHHARLASQGLGGPPRPAHQDLLPGRPQELIHQDPTLKERKNERLIQRDHSLDRGDNRGSGFNKGPGWNRYALSAFYLLLEVITFSTIDLTPFGILVYLKKVCLHGITFLMFWFAEILMINLLVERRNWFFFCHFHNKFACSNITLNFKRVSWTWFSSAIEKVL